MSSVMIVDASRLSDTPQCFQDYVDEYFHESELLGKRILWSGRTCFMPYRPYPLSAAAKKGTAPSHSVDIQRFKGLSKWLRENIDTGIFYEYHAPEPPRSGSCLED